MQYSKTFPFSFFLFFFINSWIIFACTSLLMKYTPMYTPYLCFLSWPLEFPVDFTMTSLKLQELFLRFSPDFLTCPPGFLQLPPLPPPRISIDPYQGVTENWPKQAKYALNNWQTFTIIINYISLTFYGLRGLHVKLQGLIWKLF